MPKRALTVGLGQVRVRMGDKAANVAELVRCIGEAAGRGCDLLVLPECSLAGWLSSAARRASEPIPGPFTRKLGGLARRHRMAIVVGMEEHDGDRIYNSAVWIGRDGRILAKHRKINELDLGLKVYTAGRDLGVFDAEGRTAALDICADSWRPEVTDALYLMGARLIVSPSAWAVEPGGEATNIAWIRETYRARALGRRLHIFSANGVGDVIEGPWKGRILQGNSLVIGPGGETLLQGPTNEPALLTYRLS